VTELLIRAAGGVVTRLRDGVTEIVVVHRPHYDDWSLPKGKADGDEPDADTARREVEEETGLQCSLGDTVAVSNYIDRKGRPKRVRWYRMTPVADLGFEPGDEVDEWRWVPLGDAAALLTYDRERVILDQLDTP
jgi:8-oxo-dGTP pyrophosphatase MutT (NUDIX family)